MVIVVKIDQTNRIHREVVECLAKTEVISQDLRKAMIEQMINTISNKMIEKTGMSLIVMKLKISVDLEKKRMTHHLG